MLYLDPLYEGFIKGVKSVYDIDIDPNSILVNPTKKEFEGDFTIVLFPYVKSIRQAPEKIGESIGDYLVDQVSIVKSTNVIKGFLNVELSDDYWVQALTKIVQTKDFGHKSSNGKKVIVEFSSPNTNKPLHLGHVRNILLGWSCSKILKAIGYEVIKVQVVNDRGIAICKSMLAWQKFGNNATPITAGIKSDHFVGSYYVLFEQKFKEEYTEWQSSADGKAALDLNDKEGQSTEDFYKAYKNNYFNNHSSLGAEAKAMLLKWEDNDQETKALWSKMNNWVYEGFEVTYNAMGVDFDKLYFESDTYLLGKETIEIGLERGIFYKKDDGSVWINLEDVGMDHKIVLRSDGTSVYMTQDIGTAMARYQDYKFDKMAYTVADEQDYHFKVLFEILKRFEEPYADGLYHLSYGMVDLTTGKMKSREGTVVDADDLINDVITEAAESTKDRGELDELSKEEKEEVIRRIGLAALKFFIIKVNPKKRMTFDPKESLDMQGQTGPYVQNAYVRIQSILRKYNESIDTNFDVYADLAEEEKALMKLIMDYPDRVEEAGNSYDPSTLANYCYTLAKEYHRFYHGVRILKAESEAAKNFRLTLSNQVAEILEDGLDLLGIEMPSRM